MATPTKTKAQFDADSLARANSARAADEMARKNIKPLTQTAQPSVALDAIAKASSAGAFDITKTTIQKTPTSPTLSGTPNGSVAAGTGTTPVSNTQIMSYPAVTKSDTSATDKAYTDWAQKQRNAGVAEQDISRSIYEAGGQAEITNQSKAAQEELKWGEATPEPSRLEIAMYGSYENAVRQKLLKKQELARQQAEQMKNNEEAITASQAKRENAQAGAAMEGTAAAFAQGREQGISSSNAMISPAFDAETNAKLQENALQRQNLQIQRDQLYQNLLDAQKNQRGDESDAFGKQIAAIDAQIQKNEEQNKKDNAEASAKAFETFTKLAEISKNSGGGIFTGWTPQDISTALGVDLSHASVIANIDARIGAMDTSAIDYDQKVANLKKTQTEAIWAGMTPEQRNFTYTQGLSATDKEAFLNFAGKNPTYQFIKSGESIYAANPDTGKMELVVGADTAGADWFKPTGEFVTNYIGGKTITLDSGAMVALQQANVQLNSSGLGNLRFDKGVRDQKATIRQMAADNGIPMDELNPDATAAALRASGHQVADVGNSNHEKGLAVDIVDTSKGYQYINSIKDTMNRNGWYQVPELVAKGDVGHFEFRGAKNYTDEQKAIMDTFDMGKYSTEKTKLVGTGLGYADVAAYKQTQGLTPEDKAKAESTRTKTQIALDTIQKIYDKELWKGAGYSASIPGVAQFSMTYKDLVAALDTIVSNIALDEMKSLKESSKTGSTGFGAMNEKELTLLTSSKGTLRPDMSEEALKENLEVIKGVLMKVDGIANDPAATSPKREVKPITDNAQKTMIRDAIKADLQAGATKEEVIASLEAKGIDSTQFIK